MGAAVGIDDEGALRVNRGDFVKPEPWARQLTDWLALLLAADLELFQLRTSTLPNDHFAVAAVKERTSDTTNIRVGTGRGTDAVNAVTQAVTSAACADEDVLASAIKRLADAGAIDAATLMRNGGRRDYDDERLSQLLDAFDEPGLLEVRTDQGEYGLLRLGTSGVAMAVGMREPSAFVRRWLTAVWEGIGEAEGENEREGRL